MGRNSRAGAATGDSPMHGTPDEQMLSLGRLHFLSAFCPQHRNWPAAALARLFIPAVNAGCVRFFENERGQVCAALIWARLSEQVARRMLHEAVPPDAAEWASGDQLWFLDVIAPFGHGGTVARHIARNPPAEPFHFARLGRGGALRKVVRADAGAAGQKVRPVFMSATGQAGA